MGPAVWLGVVKEDARKMVKFHSDAANYAYLERRMGGWPAHQSACSSNASSVAGMVGA